MAERRAEDLALGLLVAWLAIYWGLQYQPFLLPNNDYYSFERAAASFAAGELPGDFKRMPLFPAAMALVAPALPGPHPYLHAALLWNAAFALATVAAVGLLARRVVGPGWILVPLLLASSPQLHSMALQPLVEPSLGFFVALALLGFVARTPWQYAAAFCAALGRYEAALLIPILFLANVRDGGAWRRHLGLAAAASSGVVAWTAAGAALGSGGSSYLELMEGMGWRAAPGFAGRLLKESFVGLHPLRSVLGTPVYALAVGVPLAAGVVRGWRERRRETEVLVGFAVATTAVIVVFGIDKARYVYPIQWIPMLYWVVGALWIHGAVFRALAARPVPAAVAAGVAGAGVAVAFALEGNLIRSRPNPIPVGFDLAHAAVIVVLAASAFVAGARPPRAAWLAASAALLTAMVFLGPGGVARKSAELWDVHYANYESWLLADWVQENLAPDEGIVVFHRSHILHRTGLDRRRVRNFGRLGGSTPAELAASMREMGLTHVAYTWRAAAANPAQEYYNLRENLPLGARFGSGEPVPGFRHVATLPVPEQYGDAPVQVYRLAP